MPLHHRHHYRNSADTSNATDVGVKSLSFAFPFLRKGSSDVDTSAAFTDEHDVYNVLQQESSGSYSISGKGMWHGGIHVTEAGAGQSLDLKHGVRCIAHGEVVAWRVNRTYPVSDIPAQNGQPATSAPYSTGFALVRHTMEFPKGTTLTFFSLYMHLQDLADYDSDTSLSKPAYWATRFQVTAFAKDKPHAGPHGQVAPADQQGLRVRATKSHGTILGILPQGAQVSLGKRGGDWGQITDTHGALLMAPKAGGFVAPTAAVNGWIFLGQEHGGPVVQEVMPDTSLDSVVVPSTPFPIKAGDLIGHLGRYDALNQPMPNRMVHLEVFCDDNVKSFLEQGRTWIRNNGPHPARWASLGLPSDPTILRVDKHTTLYKGVNQEGQNAPQTDVIQVWAFAELARNSENQYTETTPGTDDLMLRWWKVDSADVRRHAIRGWVREQNFAGGRVTREFAQKWVDFQTLEDAHDPTHTMFATTQAYVDYAIGADVPSPGSLDKLSPLMTSIYHALYPTGDGNRAADELRAAAQDPWTALRMSRLIVKHESEWTNPDKWKPLITEIEKRTGPQAQHAEELKRIEKLAWWEEVKAKLPNLPAPEVFHMHPIGLVGNFACGILTIEEARLRAFLRMIRVGEGTEGAAGYERLFGGESFVKDYGKDFSDHPRILITKTNSHGRTLKSTAAGAYQVMGYTWDDPVFVSYRRQYGIDDFAPASQDRFCAILLKFKRNAIDDITNGNLQRAIFDDGCNKEWASLPGDMYDQGGVGMGTVNRKFSEYLNDELNGKSDLAITVGGLSNLIR